MLLASNALLFCATYEDTARQKTIEDYLKAGILRISWATNTNKWSPDEQWVSKITDIGGSVTYWDSWGTRGVQRILGENYRILMLLSDKVVTKIKNNVLQIPKLDMTPAEFFKKLESQYNTGINRIKKIEGQTIFSYKGLYLAQPSLPHPLDFIPRGESSYDYETFALLPYHMSHR